MPPLQSYNPIILGFVEGRGAVHVSLRDAQEAYGRLPSDYGLLSDGKNRHARRTLNLPLGLAVIELLRDGRNLPEMVARFYERWGRDFSADFGVHLERFLRRNDLWDLRRVVEENGAAFSEGLAIDIPEYLRRQGLIPVSTLHSIPRDQLLEKAATILGKRRRHPAHAAERTRIDEIVSLLEARAGLERLRSLLGGDIGRWGKERLAIHADAVARILVDLSRHLPVEGVERLSCIRGRGVEIELADRDPMFLTLGKEAGDCTADKPFRQVDRDVENIYWTVFAWFLDQHYQIAKVYFDGQFVMKVHLLPLLASGSGGGEIFLAVDAIETAPIFREDTRVGRPDLLEKKEYIFARMIEAIRDLATSMGIDHVYAERFSNTPWVRRELERLPEVYLHIGTIQKVDELEDVFELSKRVCDAAGRERPSSVFMELQMKNTFLQAGGATVRGVKVFAVLAGDARLGMPMRRVFGV